MNLTLLDIAKRKQADGFIEEALTRSPELSTLPVVPKNGIDYRVTIRTGDVTGGFRDANGGMAESKSTYEQKLVSMYYWDCPLFVDEAIATADDGSVGDLLAQEEISATRQNLITVGQQVFQGLTANTKGFAGFFAQVDGSMVVDAGGSGTTDTAWFVYASGDDADGVKIPFSSRSVLTPKPWRLATRSVDGKIVTGYETNLAWWLGLDIGSKYSIGCVKNITAAKPLTDALAEKLRSKFQVGRKPNLAFMSPAARYLLQASRSSIGNQKSNASGDAFSPLPEFAAGARVIETDSIGTIAAW